MTNRKVNKVISINLEWNCYQKRWIFDKTQTAVTVRKFYLIPTIKVEDKCITKGYQNYWPGATIFSETWGRSQRTGSNYSSNTYVRASLIANIYMHETKRMWHPCPKLRQVWKIMWSPSL